MTQKERIATLLNALQEGIPEAGPARAAWQELLDPACWKPVLQSCTRPPKRLDCAGLLRRLRPMAQHLAEKPLPENWAAYCYDAAKAFAFPGQGQTDYAFYAAVKFSLLTLQALLDLERTELAFDPFCDFAFLPEKEYAAEPHAEEYRQFLRCWRQDFVYEMLRLCDELMPYTTLSHIAAVHHIAMLAARGLRQADCPVDLAVVSAAAAVHDIGKFGCRPGERVPYLHYHYTAQWCTRMGLPAVGQIAANHSTWDLELENLPAESLCLIYADFRAKEKRLDGRTVSVIYTLKQSFEVILSKLDNVDEQKHRRYRLVYSRLRDFEQLLRSAGVDVDEEGGVLPPAAPPQVNLQNARQLMQTLIFRALRLDIEMMNSLTSDKSFTNFLEAARSEKDWKHLRTYLEILREFSIYLGDGQKRQLVDFLYELLMHREGDIRHTAADILGLCIAQFHAGYRKQLPADAEDVGHEELMALWTTTLERIVCPDHKLTRQHISRIGYTLKLVFASLCQNAQPEEMDGFLRILLAQYQEPGRFNDDSAFVLLDTMCDLPLGACSEGDLKNLTGFASYYYLREPSRLHIAAGRFLMRLTAALPKGHPLAAPVLRLVETLPPRPGATELFLRCFTLKSLGRGVEELERRLAQSETTSEVFLDDLKAGTPWIAIAVNVELLAHQAKSGRPEQLLHIATHLCNLLKVSEFIGVRKEAGQALLRLVPRLTTDQRNEIAVELLKALETGDYTFSKYIPPYLGRLALSLPAAQRSELLAALKADLAVANERVVNVALDTVEAMLAGSGALPAGEDPLRGEMLGVLLTGLAHYQEGVRQNALRLFGQLFADGALGLTERHELLGLCLQKLLTLMGPMGESGVPDGLTRYYSTAALTHLWRFVAEYQIDYGAPKLALRDKVAFFPGTFDPFTLSHKGIVEAIERLGYEVYLAVDEFSWSKNSQPHLLRSRIVQMSVADMFHAHLFPDEIPVNIANPADLARLKEAFPDRELYLVVGADVLRSASAYKAAPAPGCVLEYDHIVFRRQEEQSEAGAARRITGRVIELELPPHLEQVSSTRIRENVDSNRDISALTDPLVQEFIYQRGLYLREPRFKPVQSNCPVVVQQFSAGEPEHAEGIALALLDDPAGREEFIRSVRQNRQDLVVLRSTDDMWRVCGCVRQRVLESAGLMEALGRIDWADQVRSRAAGRILLVEPPLMRPGSAVPDADHLLLTEGLLRGVRQGCGFAVCRLDAAAAASDEQKQLLKRQGFVPLNGSDEMVWITDLRRPLVLMQNLESSIKPPFDRVPELRQMISTLRRRLQLTLASMVPGQWVLALWAPLVLQQLMDRTTALNGVPAQPTQPRTLGPAMCVPFGKILRERLVPNTVTKTLRTDRVFSPDLHTDTIEAFPGYPSLKSQLRILRSFARPVILVDDLLHQEGRLQRLLPLLREEGIPLQQVLVGVLTDHGRDSMASTGVPVDAVCRLPGLRQWFLESSLYPFVGGDTIQRGEDYRVLGLRPSINRIYPYAAPNLPGCGKEAQLEFSRCGLECARDLFLLLERLYRGQYGRSLTLGRLNEAVVLPLCPDRGTCVQYDENLSPSLYLEQDLQLLHRCFELC